MYTKQKIRRAILAAADTIETQVGAWKFLETKIPENECGTAGCALGWIGFHLGMKRHGETGNYQNYSNVPEALGYSNGYSGGDRQFYMDVERAYRPENPEPYKFDWISESAIGAAKAIRAYADKHFPCETKLPE